VAATSGPRRLRPYDLRHAALSLWPASGAPPAEVAARVGHSLRVLPAIHAHCIPGCDQIASQHIEKPSTPATGPQMAHNNPTQTPGIPSVMRPCHSWTQRDTTGPGASTQIRLDVLDLRKCLLKTLAHRLRPVQGAPGHPLSIRR
jgi:hypothetical protein